MPRSNYSLSRCAARIGNRVRTYTYRGTGRHNQSRVLAVLMWNVLSYGILFIASFFKHFLWFFFSFCFDHFTCTTREKLSKCCKSTITWSWRKCIRRNFSLFHHGNAEFCVKLFLTREIVCPSFFIRPFVGIVNDFLHVVLCIILNSCNITQFCFIDSPLLPQSTLNE